MKIICAYETVIKNTALRSLPIFLLYCTILFCGITLIALIHLKYKPRFYNNAKLSNYKHLCILFPITIQVYVNSQRLRRANILYVLIHLDAINVVTIY